MPTKIETLWTDLEADTTATSGLLYRRYAVSVKPDIFAGIRRTASGVQRLLAVSLPAPVITESVTLQGLILSVETDTARPGRQMVLLSLTDPAQTDLFAVVCEDLIAQIADEPTHQNVLNALLGRLEQWTTLFENLSPGGLSVEKRQGLFGELWFLNRWLDTGGNPADCLTAWTGPGGSIHDFQLSDQSIELKTTSSVNPQSIQISNERQLDDSGLSHLWLWMLTLDVRPSGGQSLNELVDVLLYKLSGLPMLHNQFRLKLYQAGYQYVHRSVYDTTTYTLRTEQVFRVSEGFPRIKLDQLPIGVSAVRYAIALMACHPFQVESADVFAQL
ncbi:hypothetical protein GGR92_003245 [Spirosoma lacussanchae]|uniref:PD-(D/E)XK motif protein n=1 Tax=Spirosoma lacussanchae TaxID=1884249 RepID=UPI0014861081|nr:PD-(D/E)XK motif protein [Spirosoma lacussanchae]